jgi:hypothetical protein
MLRFEDWTGLHPGNERLRLQPCEKVVKVFADTEEELIAWCRKHGLRPEWIDRRNRQGQIHFDLFRQGLQLVPPDARVLTPAEVRERIRAEVRERWAARERRARSRQKKGSSWLASPPGRAGLTP